MLSFNREIIGYLMENGMGCVDGIKRGQHPASESIEPWSILAHPISIN